MNLVVAVVVVSVFVLSVRSEEVIRPQDGQILVLGSNGLVGSALVDELHAQNYSVIEVRDRRHVDLREKANFEEFISHFNVHNISFAFFLACEVGGSKYLESGNNNVQMDIIESNLQMYNVLIPWFQRHSIPYLFTSSSLQSKLNPYGVIKRLGEQYIEASGVGKSVRLWNVFGKEPVGPRSRVITDWISSCLENQKIRSLTDGLEYRQFVYSKDCASALVIMMKMYDRLDQVTDLGANHFTRMRDLATIVAKQSPKPCTVEFRLDRPAALAISDTPSNSSAFALRGGWTPKYNLAQAIGELYVHFAMSSSNEDGLDVELLDVDGVHNKI